METHLGKPPPPPPGGSLRSTGHFVVEHALVIVPCPSVTLKWLQKCCISSNYVCDKFNIGIMYTSESFIFKCKYCPPTTRISLLWCGTRGIFTIRWTTGLLLVGSMT
jgi:hypothetical protein